MLATSSFVEPDYSILSKPECIFAAIWHNPDGKISTEAIAKYYEVEVQKIFDVVDRHHEELEDSELNDDGWTPRGAIRLGLLLNSPVATLVRSLALDVIEAHKQPSKKAAVRFLLENAQFVEWSNRAIAKIVECSPTVVGDTRKELEEMGKILKFEKRKHIQSGKEVRRENKEKMSSTGHLPDSNSDSCVNAGTDLDALKESVTVPVERIVTPKTYTEEELQSEINRAIAESKIGFKVELEEQAITSVKEQLIASQAIAQSKTKEVIELQQKIMELESLRLLEEENKRLLQRIADLERAMEPRQDWGKSTFTKEAQKVVNAEVAASVKRIEQFEPELHLRVIALVPPKRKMYSEVSELLEQIRYQMDRVPLAGRRVVYEDRYGTLADIDDENETAVIDWDFPIKSDSPDDVYRLADIEVLPTISGIAQGSNVASCDVKNPAYSWHGTVVKVYPHTNEVDVHWRELRKIKCCRVSFLRLIMSQELAEVAV
ncbi:MAG: hypothetical protein HWQ38_34280 [Nostoc sp. NMS7]|uniref:hypothetical protein n=1 Tax=Nostoc sp. NMS7 TaxID=2815391 RepID=UPI0025FD18D0|nr:hypothetical protein [Nostoc sp. NMS7]MBN3951270.1 hypothetical protein [Nostoc sp. NMS7]